MPQQTTSRDERRVASRLSRRFARCVVATLAATAACLGAACSEDGGSEKRERTEIEVAKIEDGELAQTRSFDVQWPLSDSRGRRRSKAKPLLVGQLAVRSAC